MGTTEVKTDDGSTAVIKIFLCIAACVVFPPIAAFLIGWYTVVCLLWVLKVFLTVFFTAMYADPDVDYSAGIRELS